MPIFVNALLILVAVLLVSALVLLWRIYTVVRKQKTASKKVEKTTKA